MCVYSCDVVTVRAAKFIPRQQWFVCGADVSVSFQMIAIAYTITIPFVVPQDNHIRIYNYNTMEKVREFEAHADYIRYV